MIIVGAGLAGLLAANILRKKEPVIFESQKELPNNHTALLRHRDIAISEATSIPFRKVNVAKAISFRGKTYTSPTIYFSNMYSRKVTDAYLNRSITNLKPVERYIAPPDFIQQMASGCDIQYGKHIDLLTNAGRTYPVISTIPMPIVWSQFHKEEMAFEFKNIVVATADIDVECDVYQTIYYPDFRDMAYRISITGNRVIAEFISNKEMPDNIMDIRNYIYSKLDHDFGIGSDFSNFKISNNKYGKIREIDDTARKRFIGELTEKHNIYSLGRFATWRNILLDDVYHDIEIIRHMIENKGYNTGVKK